ncbi:hypothetical protein B0H19DRAFT_1071571, partial [Mycena capillaripes]
MNGAIKSDEQTLDTSENVADLEFPSKSPSELSEKDYHSWPWAFDRDIHCLAARNHLRFWNYMGGATCAAEVREINEKVEVYDGLCGFRWCTLDSLRVESVTVPTMSSLLHQLEEVRRSLPIEQDTGLEPGHRQFLEEHISIILLASANSPSLRQSHPLIHTASKHDWNRFLYTFYVHQDEDITSHISLDTTVHLVRNHLADQLCIPSIVDKVMKRVESIINLGLSS